jgi:hypothetical protein
VHLINPTTGKVLGGDDRGEGRRQQTGCRFLELSTSNLW